MFAALLIALQTFAPLPFAADAVAAHSNTRLILTVKGRGTQDYSCKAYADGYVWKFAGPSAQLYLPATREVVGHHGAGPTWTMADGSAVKGTIISQADSTGAANVPALLLSAVPAPGSAAGALSSAACVRRYETHVGAAPRASCDAAHAGTEVKVPCTSLNSFYSNDSSPGR